jgi:magnesium transporter
MLAGLQVLEEIDSDKKYFILTNVKPNYASKLIAEMSSDDVADLLGDLKQEEKSEYYHWLGKMSK